MKRITAIIVTYNPDLKQLWNSVERIQKEVDRTIICNNSNYDITNEREYLNLEIINFKGNLGIGRAQNIGMVKAFREKSDFIIQFDQDSLMDENMIKKLLDAYKKLIQMKKKVGIVGPQEYDKDNYEESNPRFFKEKDSIENVNEVKTLISSGSLISKEVFQKFGGMKEEWFIDIIDFEYCWRLKEKGYKMYKVKNAGLAHKLGDGKVKTKIGFSVNIGSPFRHYYQFRNILYSLQLPYSPLYWKIASIIKIIFKIALYPLILEDGRERRKYMIKGVRDFFNKKIGKL